MHFIEPAIEHKLGPISQESAKLLQLFEKRRQNRFVRFDSGSPLDDLSFLLNSLTNKTPVNIGGPNNTITGIVVGIYRSEGNVLAEIETDHECDDHIFGSRLVTYVIRRPS